MRSTRYVTKIGVAYTQSRCVTSVGIVVLFALRSTSETQESDLDADVVSRFASLVFISGR